MTNNRAAKHRIRVGSYKPFMLFKCQLPKCCNFITSFTADRSRKYCKTHQDTQGKLKQEFRELAVP